MIGRWLMMIVRWLLMISRWLMMIVRWLLMRLADDRWWLSDDCWWLADDCWWLADRSVTSDDITQTSDRHQTMDARTSFIWPINSLSRPLHNRPLRGNHQRRVITPRSTFGLYEKDNARNRTILTKFTYGLNVGHHNIFKVSISAAQNFGMQKYCNILKKDPGFLLLSTGICHFGVPKTRILKLESRATLWAKV